MRSKSSLPTISRVTACAILAALQLGCRGVEPPEWKKVLEAAPPAAQGASQQQAPPTSPHVVVYLDTSASMAGYVSKDRSGQTVFSRTLQELRNLTTILNPPLDVLVRHVDARIGPPRGDSELTVASITNATFGGRETDIAGAISEFARPVASPQPSPQQRRQPQQPQPDAAEGDAEEEKPQPPARFHILVTDGVQSTDPKKQPNLGCVAGSDQVCVRRRINELLSQGWGASVIAMRSEFSGNIYSEAARGTIISHQSRRGDPQTFRPFYIYVFSPDKAALAGLTDVLKSRLRPLAPREDAIRELSLSLPYASGSARAEATIPKDKSQSLELSRAREENPARLTLRVDVDTEQTGAETFDVRIEVPWSSHAQLVGTPQERAELVAWRAVPVFPAGEPGPGGPRLPELKVVGQASDPDGRSLVQLAAQWPRGTGDLNWRVYRLEGRLNLERQTPAWVQQWSTNLDTTAGDSGKTFNLESVLLGLWRNDVLRDQVVADAYIRVGPR